METTTNSAANADEQQQPATNTGYNTTDSQPEPGKPNDKPAGDPYKTVTVEDMQDEETAKKNDLGEQY